MNIKDNLLGTAMNQAEDYEDNHPGLSASMGFEPEECKKPISIKYFINKLNYINFQNQTVNVVFYNPGHEGTISVPAKPEPCIEKYADFVWDSSEDIEPLLTSYKVKHIIIPDRLRLLSIQPGSVHMSKLGISIQLPDVCYDISLRRLERHYCEGVDVLLTQEGTVCSGSLVDFCAASFCVRIESDSQQAFVFICQEQTIKAELSVQHKILYSGECNIVRSVKKTKHVHLILAPRNLQVPRFGSKEFRSVRQKLQPAPDCFFKHPFTKQEINLKVADLSGAGFSVEEKADNSKLLPGMIIPVLEISFANDFKLECMAQVIYCNNLETKNGARKKKCGLAILDMSPRHHMILNGILHQAGNQNLYLSNKINLNDLWTFFFKTGFIYPQKYAAIEASKDQIKAVYQKLYTQSPNIARHFVYQEHGQILGHMSMLRFCSKTWMIQHHAADRFTSKKPGLAVLSQIGHFTYDSHRLYSLNLNFLICYFRPENKFPNRVFGGAARTIGDPAGCAVYTFAYLNYRRTYCDDEAISGLWEITDVCEKDLITLSLFMGDKGKLALEALDLGPEIVDQSEIETDYRQLGFKKDRQMFALRKHGELQAIALLNISDTGLNLSDLTNCITVFFVSQEGLTEKIFHAMLSFLAKRAGQNEIPVLIYPYDITDEMAIQYVKLYNLWILKSQYSDHYFRYLNRLMRLM